MSAYRQHELCVVITRDSDGSARAGVWVLLRSGGRHCVASLPWPSGAPTPAQLVLLEATVCDELDTMVLGSCGVQGVLTQEGDYRQEL